MTPVRRAGVLGRPIAHSLSPLLHRAAYRALGLDWEYSLHDVGEGELGAFVGGLDDEWAGLSLTMPLKLEAVALADHMEPMAKLLGVANTLLFSGTGSARAVVGANTDVYGIGAALREAGLEDPSSALILGGGATATSAMAALGEWGCLRPTIAVRSKQRAGGLIRAAAKMGLTPTFISPEGERGVADVAEAMRHADAVVSTIPADAANRLAEAATGAAKPGAPLLDAVYDPLDTPLLESWARAGGTPVRGTQMLLHQAAHQVRLMTGKNAPIKEMNAALVAHLTAGMHHGQ